LAVADKFVLQLNFFQVARGLEIFFKSGIHTLYLYGQASLILDLAGLAICVEKKSNTIYSVPDTPPPPPPGKPVQTQTELVRGGGVVNVKQIIPMAAVVAERLRRLTRNQIPSGSVGSNPTDCEQFCVLLSNERCFFLINLYKIKKSISCVVMSILVY
jgi:hypothetical protein